MSDLISRSAVIEVLKQTGIIQDNDLGHLVIDEINRIPTAYDIEKVVAELENRTERYKYNYHTCDNILHQQYELGQYYGVLKAIDIVRKGGVE